MRGHWSPSKVTNQRSLRQCRSHTSAAIKAGLHPFESCAYILVQGVDFSPKVCSMYLVIFTLSDHFLRVVVFEVSGTVYEAKMCH